MTEDKISMKRDDFYDNCRRMSGDGDIEEVGRVTKRKKRGLADMLWEEREAADEESDLLR